VVVVTLEPTPGHTYAPNAVRPARAVNRNPRSGEDSGGWREPSLDNKGCRNVSVFAGPGGGRGAGGAADNGEGLGGACGILRFDELGGHQPPAVSASSPRIGGERAARPGLKLHQQPGAPLSRQFVEAAGNPVVWDISSTRTSKTLRRAQPLQQALCTTGRDIL